MQKLFAYHVENKSFKPVIAQRSMKIFVEQFDPDKFYMLKGEVSPFIHMRQYDLENVVLGYQKGDFSAYLELNEVICLSIQRHRELRQRVWQNVIDGNSMIGAAESDTSDYARSEAELEYRIQRRVEQLIRNYEERSNERLTRKARIKLVQRIERKLQLKEDAYLSQNESKLSVLIMKAIAKSLDAHTAYYTPQEAKELRTALKKEFKGIGVVLRETDKGVVIADLITGGPAARSGRLKVGDRLVAINGQVIDELTFEEVLEVMKGGGNSSIKLQVLRNNSEISATLKPEKIILNDERLSYTYEPYGDGIIAKIDLPGFYDNGSGVNAEKDLKEALKALKAKGPIYGMVIDMRENSGGFLTQAVKVSSMFITQGVIVISKYGNGEVRYVRGLDGRSFYQGPLVLLTSKASASAAEIVAQSLQDYGVALVVGDERTYGKGSMQFQTVTDEGADSFFKVTVGRYYTISGRSTQIDGVKADIVVPSIFSPYNIGERYLEYPLPSDQLNLPGLVRSSDEYARAFGPYLQMKETHWTAMIPTLKYNSQQRLAGSADFQCYLKQIHRDPTAVDVKCGVDDMQMKESVAIIKDMIDLSRKMNPGQ